ncbi:MAG: hypothetical protein PF450_13640 [Bacteroidales bacterium]|jgi:hypothetical protein|nr:hypothetical protein [Bacteroidales bacterium]
MRKRKIHRHQILTLLLCSFYVSTFGQEKLIESYGYGVWIGIRDVKPEIHPDGEHLDFLNYLDSYDDYPEDEMLGMNWYVKFRGNWEVDLKIAVGSDLAPNTVYLKGRYFLNDHFGIAGAYYRYSQYMSAFDQWFINNNEDFIENYQGNYRQIKLYENNLMSGLFLDYQQGFMHLRVDLNAGVAVIPSFSTDFNRKMLSSNFRQKVVYDTQASPSLFIFPELTANFDLFHTKFSTIGIQVQSSWLYLERAMRYTETTYNWTRVEKTVEIVENASHTFSKFDIDIGLFLRW